MSSNDTWLRRSLQRARRRLSSVKANSQRFVVRRGKALLRRVYRDAPVPLNSLLFLRRLVTGENALAPKYGVARSTGRSLQNHFLASRLADVELGDWPLDHCTLDFLERQIQIHQPEVVLEFGSGVSTACLARYMRELHGDSDRVYVFSIDQELAYARETLQLLKAVEVEKHARVAHAPLREQLIDGSRTTCYDLSGDFVMGLLGGNRPDFVVIDGPAAGPDTRLGTLPLVQPFLKPGALFFLDDALRDGELGVAQRWSQLPAVEVNGVHLFGEGLLVGQVRDGI